MTIELLYFDGCPNHESLVPHLRRLLADEGVDGRVSLVEVDSEEAARSSRFLGSPTLRIDGVDVEPGASEREDYGLKCRLYNTENGLSGTPLDDWILAAIRGAR